MVDIEGDVGVGELNDAGEVFLEVQIRGRRRGLVRPVEWIEIDDQKQMSR